MIIILDADLSKISDTRSVSNTKSILVLRAINRCSSESDLGTAKVSNLSRYPVTGLLPFSEILCPKI